MLSVFLDELNHIFFLLKLGIITYQQYLVVRFEMSDPGQLRQPCRTQAI